MTASASAHGHVRASTEDLARWELRAADVYCRYLTRHHYENFAVSSLILPADLRRHLARIYAYCRLTDDLGDESGADATARLTQWREQVTHCLDGASEPVHPVLLALRHTVAACDIPRQPFLDLIEANLQDQRVSTYETWDELLHYCQYSAAPVGRMVLRVFGVRDPHAEHLSDDVCIGLQLANFAQDVAVDRAKGRTYLPQELVRTLGMLGAVQAMCERAARLLASGRELETMVPARLRIQLALYRLGGLAILSAIANASYRTDTRRPQVSRAAKVRLLMGAVRAGVQPGVEVK